MGEFLPGVMLLRESENSVVYRVACDCIEPGHDVFVDFEINKKWGMNLTFHKNLEYAHYDCDESASVKLENLFKRLFAGVKLMLTGYLEVQSDFLLMEPQKIDSFIKVLEEGRKFCLDKLTPVKK